MLPGASSSRGSVMRTASIAGTLRVPAAAVRRRAGRSRGAHATACPCCSASTPRTLPPPAQRHSGRPRGRKSRSPASRTCVRFDLDARIEVLALVERALEAHFEIGRRPSSAGSVALPSMHHEVAIAPQLHVELGQFERRTARLQVAEDDHRIVDHDAPRRQPVEVERRLVGRTLAQPEQADAAVGETHDRDARLQDVHAAGDELPGAEEVPEVEPDAAFARREQRLRAVLVEHAQVAQHDLGPVPAQARVEPRILELHVRLPLDPRAQLRARSAARTRSRCATP